MSARPVLDKIVNTVPLFVYYKPYGVSLEKLDELILTLEEIETLNLKDRQGLDQKGAARKMGILRSTFQRILKSARKKSLLQLLKVKR